MSDSTKPFPKRDAVSDPSVIVAIVFGLFSGLTTIIAIIIQIKRKKSAKDVRDSQIEEGLITAEPSDNPTHVSGQVSRMNTTPLSSPGHSSPDSDSIDEITRESSPSSRPGVNDNDLVGWAQGAAVRLQDVPTEGAYNIEMVEFHIHVARFNHILVHS